MITIHFDNNDTSGDLNKNHIYLHKWRTILRFKKKLVAIWVYVDIQMEYMLEIYMF